jgi:hypothetical protein
LPSATAPTRSGQDGIGSAGRPMSGYSDPARAVAGGDFRVGDVVSRSLSLLWRNFPAFYLLMLVASLPNLWVSESLVPQDLTTGVAFALLFLLMLYSHAVILDATTQDMRGRPLVLREMLTRPFLQVQALLGVGGVLFLVFIGGLGMLTVLSMLMSASDTFGALFVTVISLGVLAALIALCAALLAWFVALPVCVIERLEPVRCLRRSGRLTQGHRWRIFGLLLLIGLIMLMVEAFSVFVPLAVIPIGIEPTKAFVTVIAGALADAFTAVILTVTYHHLRVAKEGVDPGQIAAVFD